jgi:hypothetical protein
MNAIDEPQTIYVIRYEDYSQVSEGFDEQPTFRIDDNAFLTEEAARKHIDSQERLYFNNYIIEKITLQPL